MAVGLGNWLCLFFFVIVFKLHLKYFLKPVSYSLNNRLYFLNSKTDFKNQFSTFSTGGTTYHFGLDIFPGTDEYIPLSNEKLQLLRAEYQDLHVMILDEMSMLGAGRLYDICHRLQDIMISRDIFGGICSILGK